MYCLVRVTRPPHGAAAVSSFDPTAISLAGINLAQLAFAVLGVLLISSEYATGLIRASFAAVPRRVPVLWSKAAAFALTTFTLCVPAAFAAFGVGQSILSRQHLGTTLGEPGVARAVLGSALYPRRAAGPGPRCPDSEHGRCHRRAVRRAVRGPARGRLPARELV